MRNKAKQTMLTLVLGLVFYGMVNAQSFSNKVLAVSGNKTEVAQGYSLTYTVGEMTAVARFQSQGSMLTQGFLQPEVFISDIREANDVTPFHVYPSPAASEITIQCELNNYTIVLTSVQGKELYRQKAQYTSQTIPIDQLAAGVYLVQLLDNSNRLLGAKQIIKN